jgi:hypothetical protein
MESEKEMVFFLDGSNCAFVLGPKNSSLLIAVMFVGQNDFEDKKLCQMYLLKVVVMFISLEIEHVDEEKV